MNLCMWICSVVYNVKIMHTITPEIQGGVHKIDCAYITQNKTGNLMGCDHDMRDQSMIVMEKSSKIDVKVHFEEKVKCELQKVQ